MKILKPNPQSKIPWIKLNSIIPIEEETEPFSTEISEQKEPDDQDFEAF